MRSLASGKNVTTFTVASNEFIGGGKEKAEYQVKDKVYESTGCPLLPRSAVRPTSDVQGETRAVTSWPRSRLTAQWRVIVMWEHGAAMDVATRVAAVIRT